MFDITLITMGKLKEKFYISAADEYKKRLGGYCKFTLLELPEVRLPEDPSPAEISAGLEKEALALCEKYGFEGISPAMGHPLGDEVDFSKGKAHAARQIFNNNIRYINHCDLVIANLNNFRGWEPDGGTCFEMGYASAIATILFLIMMVSNELVQKLLSKMGE